jgi:hypothetical protein
MAQKKRKKRNPQGQKVSQNPGELQQTQSTKKMKPAAWNLLWVDLIFLAVCQIMAQQGKIGTVTSNIATIVGIVLIIVALVIQFGPQDNKPKGPRL